jgi:hypothetical protein
LIYWVRQHNPFITDVNRIRTGQKIVFPEPLEKRAKHVPKGEPKAPDEEEDP